MLIRNMEFEKEARWLVVGGGGRTHSLATVNHLSCNTSRACVQMFFFVFYSVIIKLVHLSDQCLCIDELGFTMCLFKIC